MGGLNIVQIKHFEQPSVDLPSCTTTLEAMACVDTTHVVSQTHDSSTSPLGLEVMTYIDTTTMVSQTYDLVTSPLGLESVGIDGHRVIGKRSQQTNEDLEDEDKSQ
eukprot:Gb_32260 [translate_table: standard]